MLHRLLTSCLAALTMVPILASAEEAHVHGEAVLEIVIDDAGALISFEAPAIDIVGFEYLPKTDAEQAAIDEKLALLAQIETVVTLPANAVCTVDHSHVDFEAEEHDGEVEHIAFHAEFEVECSNAAGLTSLTTSVFDHFPALEEMEVEVVSPSGQKGASMEPDRTTLEL